MSGWVEMPGGGMLARLIGDAFARAAESDEPQSEQEPADLVQGDAKLRGNSGDADATENHNEQEQR